MSNQPQASAPSTDEHVEETNLDRQYHSIAIPALAAAAKYQGSLRNQDHARSPEQPIKALLTTDQMLLLS